MTLVFQDYKKDSMAVARGNNLKVSLKKAVELNNAIRGKKVSVAKTYLEGVVEQKSVVPYKRFKAEMGHKRGKGIDTGGFPVNVAKEVLRLLNGATKNASEKEIGGDLYVLSVIATKGASRYHYGRHSGRKMKSTNLEVVVGTKEGNAKKGSKEQSSKKGTSEASEVKEK